MARKKATEFLGLRRKYCVSQTKAAKTFAVTPRTIRRWDKAEAPGPVLRLLRIAYQRDLGAIHPDWRGWHIGLDGKLYGPGHLHTSADHLRHRLESKSE